MERTVLEKYAMLRNVEVCYVEKRQKDSLENSPLLLLLVSLFNVGKRQQLRLNILTNNNLEKLSMCMARNRHEIIILAKKFR